MMRLMSTVLISSFVVFGLGGCVSKSDIEKTLTENPDIIFNIIEKNPEKFAEAASKAQMAARRVAQAKAEDEQKNQMEKEFKEPKKPEIAANRAVKGDKEAPITIIEYSDFQCPYCKQGYTTVQDISKKYGKKVRFMFKHLPLPFHPMAMPAAKRFEAIALQSPDKAYKFHDEVFNNQNKLTSDGEKFLDTVAKQVGADVAKMKKDMDGGEVKMHIDNDMAEARNFGMSGTPGFLINGVSLKGAYPMPAFEQIIDRHLASAEGRGVSSEKKN